MLPGSMRKLCIHCRIASVLLYLHINTLTAAVVSIALHHSQVSLTSVIFNGNIAEQGGAVAVAGSASLSLSSVALSNNSATAGGAIHLAGNSSASLAAVEAANNSAVSGGALFSGDTAQVRS
jgi:predicted outer membrane repeat protein